MGTFFFHHKWNEAWLLVINWLPHELQNDLRPKMLGNWEVSQKSPNFIELLPSIQSPPQNESFASPSKNLLKNRNWTPPAVRHPTRKLDCPNHPANDCSRPAPTNANTHDPVGTRRPPHAQWTPTWSSDPI